MIEISLKEMKDLLDDNEIDLSARNLETVPKALLQLPKATDIDLSQNKIVALPQELCDMTRIVKLDLGGNKLVVLPDNFGNLVNLATLNLYNNEIEQLPVSFSNLRSLKWLDLGRNNLEPALKNEIGNCSNDKECKQAAVNAVAYMKKVQKDIQNAKAMQEKTHKKIQEANQAQKAKQNNQAKKNKKETQNKETTAEEMTKHHGHKKEKHHPAEKNQPQPPAAKSSWSLFGLIFSLIRFFIRWSLIIAVCFAICATVALSFDCYSNGGTHIPNSKSFCTDLTKLAKFKGPSDRFVQNAKNAYGSVFEGYRKQINSLTNNAQKTASQYYKTSTFLKDAEKFLYKCHEVIAHYAFLVFTIITDVYHDLLKWYESSGKKSIGFIVEPLQVGAQMFFEIAKDVFWMAVDLLQKVIARSTIFLERVFAVWSQKGTGAAIDEAFKA